MSPRQGSKPSKGKAAKGKPGRDMLAAVPFQNQAMEKRRQGDGTLLVSVPIRRPRYMAPPLSWILPFSRQRRVELDPLGASVLDLCDGKATVERIIERFAAANKLTFREAQLAVGQFLQMLLQRGVVAFVGQDG